MAAPFHFKAFTTKAHGTADKIITEITVRSGYAPANPPTPLPNAISTRALWDTGASKSVISTALVQSLGLTAIGKRHVHHGDGSGLKDTYIVNFGLPNQVEIAGVVVTDWPATHTEFAVLVGMDVIGLGDFSITNVEGKTAMSFRTPSCELIDYVVLANRIAFKGVGRNDLCPCGSGKKFKRCHGV